MAVIGPEATPPASNATDQKSALPKEEAKAPEVDDSHPLKNYESQVTELKAEYDAKEYGLKYLAKVLKDKSGKGYVAYLVVINERYNEEKKNKRAYYIKLLMGG